MNEHTPGPWEADVSAKRPFVDTAFGMPVCDCWGTNAVNNARLIAAAPELLEALRPLAEWESKLTAPTLEDCERARAAIAKATGRTVPEQDS